MNERKVTVNAVLADAPLQIDGKYILTLSNVAVKAANRKVLKDTSCSLVIPNDYVNEETVNQLNGHKVRLTMTIDIHNTSNSTDMIRHIIICNGCKVLTGTCPLDKQNHQLVADIVSAAGLR